MGQAPDHGQIRATAEGYLLRDALSVISPPSCPCGDGPSVLLIRVQCLQLAQHGCKLMLWLLPASRSEAEIPCSEFTGLIARHQSQ